MDEAFGALLGDATPESMRPGPPWILGERGAPLQAPENTFASFQRALDAGVDGLSYDVHSCAGDEPVILADPYLERTTDGAGTVAEHSLPELFALDAGGWFSKAFAGETIPHLDEVLELQQAGGGLPQHLVQVHDASLIPELGRKLALSTLRPRFLSRRRDVCDALQEAGLAAGLLLAEAGEDDLAWARDRRLELIATEGIATEGIATEGIATEGIATVNPKGWRSESAPREWPCERWALGVDEPEQLFDCLRRGVNGLSTREPRRALSVRALCTLMRPDVTSYPIEVSALPVSTHSDPAGGGEWSGRWEPRAQVHNPFAFQVHGVGSVFVRRGAFEVEGLPKTFELGPGEIASLNFRIRGGSWSPGADPLLAVLFEWRAGEGREAGRLMLEAPLRRERRVVARGISQRLEMLRESPGMPPASMTLRRHGRELAIGIENPGGLTGARAVVHLAGRTWTGARTLRAVLPQGFNDLPRGLPFSCGFVGHDPRGGPEVLRRWAGGLPADGMSGAPGRLVAR